MTEKGWINKMNKLLKELMKEYSLELADIRWLISYRLTTSILSDSATPEEIAKRIWSGKLESELYNMEEKFLEDIMLELERGLIDEAWIREQFAEASELKCRRD
jgi:hypothetical protein